MSASRFVPGKSTTPVTHLSAGHDRTAPAHASTLLAFDYGAKHIGIAVGQTVTGTATPLETVSTRGGRPDWEVIDEIFTTWRPDALVVGLPLNMDGTEQAMTRSARRFGHRLRARFGVPVHWADERLSTREARERLAACDRTKLGDDAVAAQVILEGWLERATERET